MTITACSHSYVKSKILDLINVENRIIVDGGWKE
jgi:hypothetical protein